MTLFKVLKLVGMSYLFTIPAYVLTGIPGIITIIPIMLVILIKWAYK